MRSLAALTNVGWFLAAAFSLLTVGATISWWLALAIFLFSYVIVPFVLEPMWDWWRIGRPAREIERNRQRSRRTRA